MFILNVSQMESLSNPHRNPQNKNISHFMDEETATVKKKITQHQSENL